MRHAEDERLGAAAERHLEDARHRANRPHPGAIGDRERARIAGERTIERVTVERRILREAERHACVLPYPLGRNTHVEPREVEAKRLHLTHERPHRRSAGVLAAILHERIEHELQVIEERVRSVVGLRLEHWRTDTSRLADRAIASRVARRRSATKRSFRRYGS